MALWGIGDTSPQTAYQTIAASSNRRGCSYSFIGGNSCPDDVTAGVYAVGFIQAHRALYSGVLIYKGYFTPAAGKAYKGLYNCIFG